MIKAYRSFRTVRYKIVQTFVQESDGIYSIHRITPRLYCTSSKSSVWLEAAKEGNVKSLASMVKNDANILKERDNRGWTALMHSARHGKMDSVHYLLQQGAGISNKSKCGATALELALFWKHSDVALLFPKSDREETLRPSIFFTGSPLNRTASMRSHDTWLMSAVQNMNTKYMLLYRGKPVVITSDSNNIKLLTLHIMECHEMIQDLRRNLIFLGVDDSYDGGADSVNAYFAIDISDTDFKAVEKNYKGSHTLAVFPDALRLSPEEAGIVGQARALSDWHFRYKYCPTCGHDTVLTESGYKRICSDASCLSHTGVYNTNYPRTDPSVITTVLSRDTEHCLLGRKRMFPPGMYTCLAGFVEPGESVEMACIREIEEEVGVKADSVEYIASQPWPMPNALMLGCFAHTDTTSSLKVDQSELEDARWFNREEIAQMLTFTHPDRLFVPPQQALAHQLLKHWVLRTA